jgi:hypothetical protein
MGFITDLFGGGDDKTLDPATILEHTRTAQRMQNPNRVNPYGTSNTTFDENDQATVTQQFSPDMQNTYNQQVAFHNQGPQVYTPQQNSYNQGMQQQFNNSVGARAGFNTPQRQQYQPRPQGQYQPQQGPQPVGQQSPSQIVGGDTRNALLGNSLGGEGGGGFGGSAWGGGTNDIQGMGTNNGYGGGFGGFGSGGGGSWGGGNIGFGTPSNPSQDDSDDEDGESMGWGGLARDGLMGLASGGPVGGLMGAVMNRLRRRRRLRDDQEERVPAPNQGGF